MKPIEGQASDGALSRASSAEKGAAGAHLRLVPIRLAYSVDEAAELLGVGRSLLHDEISAGRLRVARVGRRVLVPADALRELLTMGGISGGDAPAEPPMVMRDPGDLEHAAAPGRARADRSVTAQAFFRELDRVARLRAWATERSLELRLVELGFSGVPGVVACPDSLVLGMHEHHLIRALAAQLNMRNPARSVGRGGMRRAGTVRAFGVRFHVQWAPTSERGDLGPLFMDRAGWPVTTHTYQPNGRTGLHPSAVFHEDADGGLVLGFMPTAWDDASAVRVFVWSAVEKKLQSAAAGGAEVAS